MMVTGPRLFLTADGDGRYEAMMGDEVQVPIGVMVVKRQLEMDIGDN